MAARRSGLGRGLSALMEEMGTAAADSGGIQVLPVAAIEPNQQQPRRHFDDDSLQELADSIRQKGVLQPILVRPIAGGRYEIVAGERRWRAAQRAGLHELPVVVRNFSDVDGFEAALIENVQRRDLDPLEEAAGYQRLVQEYGHTQEMVAAVTGKARSHVANLLRLLDLPEEVRQLLHEGRISVGHAKAALQAADPLALARSIVANGWTVRQAEDAARKSRSAPNGHRSPAAPARATARDPDLELLESGLSEALGLAVAIETHGRSGRLIIRFSDFDQLDAVMARLQG